MTLRSVIYADSDATQLAAYASLFWPDFVSVAECVILAEHYSAPALERWLRYFAGDRARTEQMMNQLHVDDLCQEKEPDVDPTVSTLVAETLASCWRAALTHAFPRRRFSVVTTSATSVEGAELTFSQADTATLELKDSTSA